ncbi:hypothetical protein ACU20_06345 [Actinobaculum suis]|nr:hypothetical protein ACU20_06345 [Actinobaculum suis]
MKLKRLIALALAFAVACMFGGAAFARPAFAAPAPGDMPTDNGSITVHKLENNPVATEPGDGTEIKQGLTNKPLEGVTFRVTKVQGLDLTDNESWEKVKGLTFDEDRNEVRSGSETFSLVSGSPKSPSVSKEMKTDNQGVAKFEDLEIGVYLVQEIEPGNNPITKKADPFFVTIPLPSTGGKWLTDVHVYPKNDVKGPGTKEVTSDKDLRKIGDKIPWTITTKATQAKPTKYGVVDQLPDYLDYVEGSATVTIDGVQLTPTTDFTITQGNTPAKHVKIALTDTGLQKVTAGAAVVFNLSTELKSLPNGGIVDNTAWPIEGQLDPFGDWEKNPKVPPTTPPTTPPITPTEKPKYGQYQFKKVDAQNPGQALSGAKFGIYADEKGTDLLAEATSDANGVVNFPGIYLGKGDKVTERVVYLKEIEAPAGYVLSDTVRTIHLKPGAYQLQDTDNVTNTQQKGPNLPLTGAQGKLLLSVSAIAVLALAGGLAFRNSRSKVRG